MKKIQYINKKGEIKTFDIHKKWDKNENKEFLERIGCEK